MATFRTAATCRNYPPKSLILLASTLCRNLPQLFGKSLISLCRNSAATLPQLSPHTPLGARHPVDGGCAPLGMERMTQ